MSDKSIEEQYRDLLSKSPEELHTMAADPKTRARIQRFLRYRAQITFNKRTYKEAMKHPNKPGRRTNKPNMKNWRAGGI